MSPLTSPKIVVVHTVSVILACWPGDSSSHISTSICSIVIQNKLTFACCPVGRGSSHINPICSIPPFKPMNKAEELLRIRVVFYGRMRNFETTKSICGCMNWVFGVKPNSELAHFATLTYPGGQGVFYCVDLCRRSSYTTLSIRVKFSPLTVKRNSSILMSLIRFRNPAYSTINNDKIPQINVAVTFVTLFTQFYAY